jgi:hypothetical protein
MYLLELLDIFLITDLKEGDDRDLYQLIGKMIKPIGQRISLPDVIEQLKTNLTASHKGKFSPIFFDS